MKSITDSLGLDVVEEMNRISVNGMVNRIEEYDETLRIPEDEIALVCSLAWGKKFLDVGCGWARYADRFLSSGFDYTGIDVSPEMVKQAKLRHPSARFEAMSFRRLAFEDKSFETLWSFCSISYEPKRNTVNVLREMTRVLASGGIMAISVLESDKGFEVIMPSRDGRSPVYQSGWSYQEFICVLKEARLDIVDGMRRGDDSAMTFIVRK